MTRLNTIVLATALTVLFIGAAHGQQKIVTIKMDKVFDGYYKTFEAEAALEQAGKVSEETAKGLAKSVSEARDRRDKMQDRANDFALSKADREKAAAEAQKCEREYREKREELRRFMEKKQKEMQQEYLAKRKSVVEEITEQVRAHAEKGGIDMVVDVSGLTSNMIPVIVYSSGGADITDDILAVLNRGHEKEVEEHLKRKAEKEKERAGAKPAE